MYSARSTVTFRTGGFDKHGDYVLGFFINKVHFDLYAFAVFHAHDHRLVDELP
ncbi:MAG TPA: hypothetical protein VKV02_08435 [Acidobacteriaceae bacterium]|nr:hypothetical protein [Acidobacteriaceae bacterium]